MTVTFRRTPLAAALIAAFCTPGAASAQDTTSPAPVETPAATTRLPEVQVRDQQDSEAYQTYKAERASSPKFTQSLLDTPQTINVIKKEVLSDQGATNLSQALRNTPGITFQLGESGNATSGDAIFLRGVDTQNSIFLDGIRDSNASVRDVFNLEQVEIVKGPSGADIGRSATSGYINQVSKRPQAESFVDTSLAYGEADQRRATLDINQRLGETSALRVNLLAQDGGVPGRDTIERQSWGVAPAVVFGLGTPTRIYAFSQHIRQNNVPDGTVAAIGVGDFQAAALAGTGIDPKRVDRDNFYGLSSDFEDIESNVFTARIEHDFTPAVTLSNVSRYAKHEQERVLTQPRDIFLTDQAPDPDGAGEQPAPPPTLRDPEDYTVELIRADSFREDRLLTNQTNLSFSVNTGRIQHAISGGVEFIYEEQFIPRVVPVGTQPQGNLYNPDRNGPAAPMARSGASTDGNTLTLASYLFDTLELTERWQLNAGLRLERYDTETTSIAVPVSPATQGVATRLEDADNLFSWKAGALFKPVPNGSVYLSFANSRRPPGSDNFALNAGTPNATTGAINANTGTLDPQRALNSELGTKWDFMNGRLAATAALFRSVNKDDLARADPGDPDAVIQYGERVVEGIELGAVGEPTKGWLLTAGLTFQETEVKEGSVSNATGTSTQTGADINFSPKLSASLTTSYQVLPKLMIGGGARYVDTQARTVSNDPAATFNNTGSLFEVPSYTVLDANAAYDFTPKLGLQFNAYNVTDKFYVAAVNNRGQRYLPGAPLSYLLTLTLRL